MSDIRDFVKKHSLRPLSVFYHDDEWHDSDFFFTEVFANCLMLVKTPPDPLICDGIPIDHVPITLEVTGIICPDTASLIHISAPNSPTITSVRFALEGLEDAFSKIEWGQHLLALNYLHMRAMCNAHRAINEDSTWAVNQDTGKLRITFYGEESHNGNASDVAPEPVAGSSSREQSLELNDELDVIRILQLPTTKLDADLVGRLVTSHLKSKNKDEKPPKPSAHQSPDEPPAGGFTFNDAAGHRFTITDASQLPFGSPVRVVFVLQVIRPYTADARLFAKLVNLTALAFM